MSRNNIDFVTYCIGNLSRRLNMSAGEVYRRLKQSGILTGYIIPSYDVLHTFGKEYLMDDLIEYMKENNQICIRTKRVLDECLTFKSCQRL